MVTTRVSVQEYLERMGRHGFRDEYIDGEIREKAMGGKSHAAWVVAIAAYFHRHRHEWDIRALIDLHVHVSESNYRIGDVAIVDRSVEMNNAPLRQAPIAVFEILSPTDSESETVERLRDYKAMGAQFLYLVDPESGIFRQSSAGSLTPVTEFIWPARNVRIPFADIALELD
jgi:Uma2 family endonuclease